MTKIKTIAMAAGIAISVVALGVVLTRTATVPDPQQFMMVRQLSPGEDPMSVARSMMGGNVVENTGFFGVNYSSLDDPRLTGVFV